MAADNTRKTSNIIHDLDKVKDDVSNNSQNIQNNTDAIGNISIPVVNDGEINLEAGDGLTLSAGNENATANQDSNTTFKIEANLTYLNDNLNIPVGGVSKIVAGDNVTISPANGTGDVTINAAGSGSGGIPEAPINGKQYGREDGNWTEITSATPVVPGDGNITLKSTDNTVSITGANATANQTTDTAWDLSVNIPTPPTPITPGDGAINLTGGTGIDVTGANGTANQTSDSNQTISIDSTVALKSDIPTDLGVLTIENITPHADGNFDFTSSDAALVVGNTAHGLSLSIDEDELDFVKEIKSGNELTLTVDTDANGTVTLTAAGGGGGGAGNIAFAGGKCIDVDPETVGDLTTYTINNDLDCLNSSLGFATDQDITDAIGNITIPEKTSDLVNDGEGTDPFITAADIPAIIPGTLPISSTDGTVILDSPSANTFTVSTGGVERLRITDDDIKASSGYEPQTDNSLVTKGWVTGGGTNSTGGYLPLAGGTMDAAADVIIPSGNSVNANLMVGGVVGDTIRDSFNIAARGTTQQPNAQVVAWAKPGGSAYLKLCTTEDISSYWNIIGSAVNEDGTNYLRFASESQNWVTYSNATKAGDRKIIHVPYTQFDGGIGTDTITTKDATSGDASIDLGANLTVSTGGSQSVIVTADKRVGFGATPAASVKFQNTGSAATGMRSDITHNSSTRYQNSDGQLMVTTAAGTADIGAMSGLRIAGSTASGATVDQYWGIYVSTVPTGAGIAAGFRTTVNGDGADEGKASVNGFFNVYADGVAPNYFGGEVRITPTAQLNVNKIVGATAPDNDASIELDTNLTVSTGGVERVTVKPASYGSAAVTIGEDHAHSIGGVSVRNDPTQVNYASQMQMRFVDENGKYAYIGCTEPRFAIGGDNALLDGGAFFAGHDNGNSVLFSKSGDVIIATAGLADSSERLRITDEAAVFNGQVQTSSVSGLADNDASIALGANLIAQVGDGQVINFQVNNAGKLTISGNDITASSGYEPQTDNSLVTKGWVAANGASGELPISSEDASVTLKSPAEDEFEVELAGEMKLRITANDIQVSPGYQPQSDTSLVTKRFLYGQGNGNNPIVPPGQDSGASWQTIVVDQSEYPNAQVRLQNHVLACDGIFTIGPAWSVNGVDWFESGSGSGNWTEDEISRRDGHVICKGTLSVENGQSMYMTGSGSYFSYNMKNWIAVPNAAVQWETNNSPVWYWNNDFFLNQYDTNVGDSEDDSGRIPSIRSVDRQWQSAMRYDYSTGRWSITRKEADVWFYGQTAPTPSNGYPSDDDIPFLKYPCSKSDGTMTIGVQPPFTYNVNSPDTASRLCYIKPNANQDIDSENNAYQAAWEVIPQFSDFDAGEIQGISYDEEEDRWVFITDRTAYFCQGNPATETWRSAFLPYTANWSEGFHYNGIRFIAVSASTNSNICVYSDDGLGWQYTSNIQTNSEYTACGTNGRSILSGTSDTLANSFTYALTPVHVESVTTTADVNLNEPVDTSAAYTERTGRKTLLTQEDANGYFDEEITANAAEIAKKASVVTLSQAEYDALTEVDENTLYLITPL